MARHHTRPSTRRGYTLLLAVIVLAMSTAVIGWNLRRSSLRARAGQMQVDRYALHHEMLGVRDIVTVWLQRDADKSKLPEYARSGAVAYEVTLPGGKVVRVRVRDGQGTILANLNKVKDEPPQTPSDQS